MPEEPTTLNQAIEGRRRFWLVAIVTAAGGTRYLSVNHRGALKKDMPTDVRLATTWWTADEAKLQANAFFKSIVKDGNDLEQMGLANAEARVILGETAVKTQIRARIRYETVAATIAQEKQEAAARLATTVEHGE